MKDYISHKGSGSRHTLLHHIFSGVLTSSQPWQVMSDFPQRSVQRPALPQELR